jgi:hypothetical protein
MPPPKKKPASERPDIHGWKENGAGNGIRTRDIHLGKVELYR